MNNENPMHIGFMAFGWLGWWEGLYTHSWKLAEGWVVCSGLLSPGLINSDSSLFIKASQKRRHKRPWTLKINYLFSSPPPHDEPFLWMKSDMKTLIYKSDRRKAISLKEGAQGNLESWQWEGSSRPFSLPHSWQGQWDIARESRNVKAIDSAQDPHSLCE